MSFDATQPMPQFLRRLFGENLATALSENMKQAGLPADWAGDFVFISHEKLMAVKGFGPVRMRRLHKLERDGNVPPIGLYADAFSATRYSGLESLMNDAEVRKAFYASNEDLIHVAPQEQMRQMSRYEIDISDATSAAFKTVAEKHGIEVLPCVMREFHRVVLDMAASAEVLTKLRQAASLGKPRA